MPVFSHTLTTQGWSWFDVVLAGAFCYALLDILSRYWHFSAKGGNVSGSSVAPIHTLSNVFSIVVVNTVVSYMSSQVSSNSMIYDITAIVSALVGGKTLLVLFNKVLNRAAA